MVSRSDLCSRRCFIVVMASLPAAVAAAAQPDFWNSKEPADYTVEEKHRMVTNSPWAKRVRAEGLTPAPKITLAPAVSARPPCPIPGASGGSPVVIASNATCLAAADENAETVDSKHSLAYYGQVTVCWESAKPILQVTGLPLPAEFRNHYVISVSGLPVRLLNEMPSATLSASSHKRRHISARFVRLMNRQTLFFAFPDRSSPTKAENSTIEFTMHLSGITVRAQFHPEEMTYRGQLAL
jgi:hypothetical protein